MNRINRFVQYTIIIKFNFVVFIDDNERVRGWTKDIDVIVECYCCNRLKSISISYGCNILVNRQDDTSTPIQMD